jgi:hypothetical protein
MGGKSTTDLLRRWSGEGGRRKKKKERKRVLPARREDGGGVEVFGGIERLRHNFWKVQSRFKDLFQIIRRYGNRNRCWVREAFDLLPERACRRGFHYTLPVTLFDIV